MDRFDDDTLFAELRELRPTPRPGFAAELDRRAAAGFPRGERSSAAMPFALVAEWWRGLKLPRRLVPIVGIGLAAVVVATVVVSISQSGGGSSQLNVDMSGRSMGTAGAEKSTEKVEQTAGGAPALPQPAEVGGACAKGTAGCNSHGEFNGNFFGEAKGAEAGESEASTSQAPSETYLAGGHPSRDIERSAYIVLGTKPGEVSGAAAKVYEAVHTANGVVLHSSVQSGNSGATGASFDLLIPSAKSNDALAAISSIAEVRQRHDATNDITAPTVSAAEELADSNAAIQGLLKQLAGAETEAERESVEAALREERHHHASIRASLDRLRQRASMSEVTVRIVTDHGAGVTPPSKGNGSWGVGNALHDAGHVLTIAAGVLLIGLAVLAPFALIGLLVWAANHFRLRRLRERTLG